MATGGYKLCKYSWTGTGFGDEETRLDSVLSNIVETLCENSDWEMDTNFHSNASDYTPSSAVTMINYEYFPNGESNSYFGFNKICFLTNGTLFLALGITTGCAKFSPDDIIVPVNIITHSSYTAAANSITGLYFSISTTGNWTTSVDYGITLPSDATKWSSFGRTKSYYQANSSLLNFVRDNTANVIYDYYFLTKGNQIAVIEKCSNWGADKLKCIVAGNLIGAFAHSSDSNALCCISLSENLYNVGTSSNDIGNRGESTAPESNIDSDHYINQETNYCYRAYNSNSNTQIFRVDGSQPNPYNSVSNTGVRLAVSNPEQLSVMVSNPITGGTRWCPLQVQIQSNDPLNNGVVENDGFKGYLDTDFIRAITIGQYNLGATFGTTNDFVYIGGGIAIGWSDLNSETLF